MKLKADGRLFATRHLLLVEVLLALVMLSWGISGWLGPGMLHATLKVLELHIAWGVFLCTISGVHATVSASEWVVGRLWPQGWIYRSITVRCVCSFLATCVWIYVIYLGCTVERMGTIFTLMLQATVALTFSAFAFCGNSKIQCVLDPKVPTDRLEAELLLERKVLR